MDTLTEHLLVRPLVSSTMCSALIREMEHMTKRADTGIDAPAWQVLANSPDLADQLRGARRLAAEMIRNRFFPDEPKLWADYTSLHRLDPGQGHPLHADMETLEGEANHTPWRIAAGLLYLNTAGVDYQGGVISWPHLGIELAPKAGTFVGFLGTKEYAHQVTNVTEGHRYAVAWWYTTEEERAEQW